MPESLEEIQKRLTHKYLGKAGVHGIGIRRSQNVLCIYMQNTSSSEQKILLEEIKNEIAPYEVLAIEEERPTITSIAEPSS